MSLLASCDTDNLNVGGEDAYWLSGNTTEAPFQVSNGHVDVVFYAVSVESSCPFSTCQTF